MEAVSFSSDAAVASMEKLILVSSFVVDTLLAAQRSLACFFMLTEALLKDGDAVSNLIGSDQRFPMDELHRRKQPEPENKDGSDTEDDDEEDDDDADQEEDDDAGDEDFSGEEGGEDDEEGDPEEDPVANGNGGSDDEDEDEGEDADEDEDGDEDEDEEEDDDEEEQPPAKKRK